ncbi:MAG: HAMP domain-containing protein [Phycisphaeraceae bacterium]|nr:HAMP domain-containing protein [Phycisphaeraceae bacterium]
MGSIRLKLALSFLTVGVLSVGITAWLATAAAAASLTQAQVQDLIQWVMLWSVLVISAVLLLSLVLSSGFTRPISRLTIASRSLGEGRLEVRVSDERTDEIGDLARAFNDMAARLESAHWGMEEANRRLQETNQLLRRETGEQRERIETLSRIAEEFSRIQDRDILLTRVLTEARRLTTADAGSVYLREGDELVLYFPQNDTLSRRTQPRDQEMRRLFYVQQRLPLSTGSIAGAVALTGRVLNIPDVRRIDPGAPYRFEARFDEQAGYLTRAMLTVPLITESAGTVGVLQLINPSESGGVPGIFTAADERLMANFAGLAGIAIERAQLTRSIIMRMIRIAEARDPTETGPHVNRVADVSMHLFDAWARRHGLDVSEAGRRRDRLRMAAMLHDVGKVAVPDSVLRKVGPLTDEERHQMQQHVLVGAGLFAGWQTPLDQAARDVALFHHARWDGLGYPDAEQLRSLRSVLGDEVADMGTPAGDHIPLFARIVAVADVFDALASRRSYKDAWLPERILGAVRAESGKAFDPELVSIFEQEFEDLLALRARYHGDEN